MQPQNFLIDADDTLWENNIYYERVIEEFFDSFNHIRYSRSEMRETLNEIEHANFSTRGYGTQSFRLNLIDACYRLSEQPPSEDCLKRVAGLADRIAVQEVELIDGVQETLDYLSRRHRLILLTKGQVDEQTRKIDRSGLQHFFSGMEIVPEKNLQTYQQIIARHALDSSCTWMVGNSPRSDINPALAAGLNAVFIPHNCTWMLEHEELATGPGQLRVLERFSMLREHF